MYEQEEQEELPVELYTLVDEEGQEQDFELIDMMEIEGDSYYAFVPYFEEEEDISEDDEQIVVLKAQQLDGEEILISIDDDEEYDRIGAIFIEKFSEMFEAEYDQANELL